MTQCPLLAGLANHRVRMNQSPASNRRRRKSRTLRLERLEDRRLMVGTTIITHGQPFGDGEHSEDEDFQDVFSWVDTMADAILDRASNSSGSIAAKYTLKLTPHFQDQVYSGVDFSLLSANDSPVDRVARSHDEVIIKLDWTALTGLYDSDDPDDKVDRIQYRTGPIGESLAQWLLDGFDGANVNLLAGPVHLIGHSRGTSLNTALAKTLAEHGVWIDQFTTLDPHPATWTDPYGETDQPIVLWDNIRFADNYWRENLVGEHVEGAYNVTFREDHLIGGYPDIFLGLEVPGVGDHRDVHLWYHGTIDTSAEGDGDAPLPADNAWYPEGERGPRDEKGFYFSRIGAGERTTEPANEGLANAGSRSRDHVPDSDRWANLDPKLTYRGGSYPFVNSYVHVFYRYQASEPCTIEFGYDSDRNPFNGARDCREISKAATASIGQFDDGRGGDVFLNTNTIPVGTHYLYAKITSNDGHVRYAYGTERITVGLRLPLPRPPLYALALNPVQAITGRELAASAAPSPDNCADLAMPAIPQAGASVGALQLAPRAGSEPNLRLDFELDLDALLAVGPADLSSVDAVFAAVG